jgi:tetratricopeptide (TPR) repeat protein
MIKLDPKDRPLHLAERNRPVGMVIAMILVLVVALGASIFYWQMSSKYTDRTSSNYNGVLKQLNILPLPPTVVLQPRVYNRLDQLSRKPCYQDAIVELSDALLDAGYPRESATSLLAFARRCGTTNNEELLTRAYSSLKKVGDFAVALQIADQLVDADPADASYRYSRGATYEQLGVHSKSLSGHFRPDYKVFEA